MKTTVLRNLQMWSRSSVREKLISDTKPFFIIKLNSGPVLVDHRQQAAGAEAAPVPAC